jgi:hypothetical protein
MIQISNDEAMQVQARFTGAVVTLQVFLSFFNKFEQRRFRAALEKYTNLHAVSEARAVEKAERAQRRGNQDSDDDFDDDDRDGDDEDDQEQ